jgi:hypothetical protein
LEPGQILELKILRFVNPDRFFFRILKIDENSDHIRSNQIHRSMSDLTEKMTKFYNTVGIGQQKKTSFNSNFFLFPKKLVFKNAYAALGVWVAFLKQPDALPGAPSGLKKN